MRPGPRPYRTLSALVFTARSGLAAHVPLPWLFSLSGALPTSNQVLHAGSVPFLGAVFGVGGAWLLPIRSGARTRCAAGGWSWDLTSVATNWVMTPGWMCSSGRSSPGLGGCRAAHRDAARAPR
jgi:hypothetical protein